jgi:hypothetical protein
MQSAPLEQSPLPLADASRFPRKRGQRRRLGRQCASTAGAVFGAGRQKGTMARAARKIQAI